MSPLKLPMSPSKIHKEQRQHSCLQYVGHNIIILLDIRFLSHDTGY